MRRLEDPFFAETEFLVSLLFLRREGGAVSGGGNRFDARNWAGYSPVTAQYAAHAVRISRSPATSFFSTSSYARANSGMAVAFFLDGVYRTEVAGMVTFAGIDVSNVLLAGMKTAETNGKFIAGNIANADTPNYTPARMDFQKSLRAALEGRDGFELRTSRSRHFDFTERHPQFEGLAFLSKNDYNKVDLDQEVVELSENTSKYMAYASLLKKKFEMAKGTLDSLAR